MSNVRPTPWDVSGLLRSSQTTKPRKLVNAYVVSSPVIGTNTNDTVFEMLVDSGPTGYYLTNKLILGLQNQMNDCQKLTEIHKIVTVGHHSLEGIDMGMIKGTVIDQDGKQHHLKLSGTIVPGPGHHLFSVLKRLRDNNRLYSFSLKLNANDKKRVLRAEPFDVWHRRMRHISARSLEILNMVEGNGLSCCGDGLAYDVCTIARVRNRLTQRALCTTQCFPFGSSSLT